MFNIFKNMFSGNNPDLIEVLKQKPFLVDVRSKGEYAMGSAKGAVNIPLDELPNNLDKFKNKNHIVVFCQSGGRSGQAMRILNDNGFDNVTNGGGVGAVKMALENV